MTELVATYSSYGAHGLLLIAVLYLTRVITYQNSKIEAMQNTYVEIIKEQIKVLTQLHDRMEEGKNE